jgi:epoxyqueuosine reductase
MILSDSNQLKEWGIVEFGYTTQAIPQSIDQYNLWINKKDHLPLSYLEGIRQEKRQSVKDFWPEFNSALVFLFSYHDAHQKLQSLYQNDPEWDGLKLGSYTLGFEGLDYHQIIKERLVAIGEELKRDYEGLEYKLVIDIHPVLERDLAFRSGLGWFGKNSMLINRNHGSFFLIGSILLNITIPSLEEKKIETDHCGQCSRCVDACPTNAIDAENRTIIAKDCISTFTIEQFKMDTVPGPKLTLKDGFIFGCDICQDVCPWNLRVDRKNKIMAPDFNHHGQKRIIDFFLKRQIKIIKEELFSMSEGTFKKFFKTTSFERSGKRGVLKNIIFYIKELNCSRATEDKTAKKNTMKHGVF